MTAEFIPVQFENSNGPEVIGPLWQKMSKHYFSMNLSRADYPVGVGAMWWKDPGLTNTMLYFAGYEISELPEEPGALEVLVLEPANYAFVEHNGPIAELPAVINNFYTQLLPTSGFERVPGMDLEIYYESEDPKAFPKVVVAAPVL